MEKIFHIISLMEFTLLSKFVKPFIISFIFLYNLTDLKKLKIITGRIFKYIQLYTQLKKMDYEQLRKETDVFGFRGFVLTALMCLSLSLIVELGKQLEH